MGLTGYFRKFIQDYATIARPLTGMLKKQVTFFLSEDAERTICELKECLARQPVLQIYRKDAQTQLHTDASQDGHGAVLMQLSVADNSFHPVYYFSSKTTPAEQRFSSYELEALAIVRALERLLTGLQ